MRTDLKPCNGQLVNWTNLLSLIETNLILGCYQCESLFEFACIMSRSHPTGRMSAGGGATHNTNKLEQS